MLFRSNKYELGELWCFGMPRLKLRLYQLERFMQMYIPEIYSILIEKKIPFELFSVQWYVTLFSHDFTIEILAKVWDLFLFSGWKYIFQLSLSILKYMEKGIETLNYDELLIYLKSAIVKKLIPEVIIIFYYRRKR